MKDDTMRTVKGYQMKSTNRLTQSLEDYLEMVYRLERGVGFARLGEVAQRLGVGASSASKMVQKLGALGFVQYERYGVIRLTAAGREAGAYLIRRHEVVRRFFQLLHPNGDTLQETELVEHCLTPATVERLEKLVQVLENNPKLLR
ncbi:MAG TPA: winged helix DNA-binding protein [Clostridiales bacterium]|nr:winged helix DNA-binding protein [Clostridiales bacterium]